MRYLICGGRRFDNSPLMNSYLDANRANIDLIITGAQRFWTGGKWIGADFFAIQWAWLNEVPFISVPARFATYGKKAGNIRNRLMLQDWKPDRVIAFPGNQGTRNMIDLAADSRIPFEYVGW